MTVLEKHVEAALRDDVRTKGGNAYKFTSPGRRSVPDRLVLMPISDQAHRDIVARYIRFVETKRPGQKATSAQEREHERIRALGFRVEVIDTKEGAFDFVFRMVNL